MGWGGNKEIYIRGGKVAEMSMKKSRDLTHSMRTVVNKIVMS